MNDGNAELNNNVSKSELKRETESESTAL